MNATINRRVTGLKHRIDTTARRIWMAELIGWPALADSFRRDLKKLRAQL